MSRIELQTLLAETKQSIANLIADHKLIEAAEAMDALTLIQADLIKVLLAELNSKN